MRDLSAFLPSPSCLPALSRSAKAASAARLGDAAVFLRRKLAESLRAGEDPSAVEDAMDSLREVARAAEPSGDPLDGLRLYVRYDGEGNKEAHLDAADWADGDLADALISSLEAEFDIVTYVNECPPPEGDGWEQVDTGPLRKKASEDEFKPDYTPDQLRDLGVYENMYGLRPERRLAGMVDWPGEWVSEHDPHGWLEWYDKYSLGRRIPDEDSRQIKRWKAFKSRHGASLTANPTPRRAFALRNWAVNPENLLADDPTKESLRQAMTDYEANHKAKFTKTGADSWEFTVGGDRYVAGMDNGHLFIAMDKVASGRPFVVAVDLDGTLAEKQEPHDPGSIGAPRAGARELMDSLKSDGCHLLIFTVRDSPDLVSSWLRDNKIPFDSINESPWQPEGASGKVLADVYLDDRAINALDLVEAGAKIREARSDANA